MNCDLCGSSETEILWEKTSKSRGVLIWNGENLIHHRNVICSKCGLVYLDPRMTDDELKIFYEEDYRKLYPYKKDGISSRLHAQNAYSILESEGLTEKRSLDVGCGEGILVKMLNGYGIDPGSEGERIERVSLEEYEPPELFDVVIMLNVLEHVPHPLETLERVRSFLGDDGHFLISVPNLYNRTLCHHPDVFFSSAHLYTFNAATLASYLARAGFRSIKVYEAIETIGDKIYILAGKDEPISALPEFTPAMVKNLKLHLTRWAMAYEMKEKILEMGFRL